MIRQNAPAPIHSSVDNGTTGLGFNGTSAVTTGVTGSEIWTISSPDFNSLLVRMYGGFAATTTATATSTITATIQTSYDGGTTFYDVAKLGTILGTTTVTLGNAILAKIGSLKGSASYIGTTAIAGTLAVGNVKDVPLGSTMRTILTFAGTAGSANCTVDFIPVDQDFR